MTPKLHTIIMSDLHLTDAELGQPGKSLWKRYKRPKFFLDQSFRRLLKFIQSEVGNDPVELVLNGDIFDFDSVMRLPLHPGFHISWLEKKRGLFPEEEKSRFKMEVILHDHAVWIEALKEFVHRGNKVVFVIGNHDVELHWPAVQREIHKALDINPEDKVIVRFAEWFYISNEDTTIEHGNQYDDYCVTTNPIHPLIKKGRRIQVRLPFGNIAGRYMVNGMGLFNPHVETSFLMDLPEYFKFFYKYALRVQPFLFFTWFWSAIVSFFVAVGDGLLPSMRDPLFIEQRVKEIAEHSNSTPEVVRTLNELKVHSAIFNPLKIARELWLDRALLLAVIVFLSFEIFAVVNLMIPISWVWQILFFIMLTPGLVYYSRKIKSDVIQTMEGTFKHAPMVARVTHTKRVVFGHTHRELHTAVDQTEVLNTGTWSAAFKDPECRESFGKKCFAWIRTKADSAEPGREADLYIWNDPGIEKIPVRI
ncbi:MAG: metallophosphoesterase [Bdellovibrionales bacterium]|nr:metallophosphoesterase [Oligoflexia bacterium]